MRLHWSKRAELVPQGSCYVIFPAELPPMQIAAIFFHNALENSTHESTIGALQYHKLNYPLPKISLLHYSGTVNQQGHVITTD